MTTDDDKTLYTLQNMLHAQVIALGEMLLKRQSAATGENYDRLRTEWRNLSRRQFRETMRLAMEHPDCPSPVPSQQMLATAENLWRLEDMMQSSRTEATET